MMTKQQAGFGMQVAIVLMVIRTVGGLITGREIAGRVIGAAIALLASFGPWRRAR